MELSGTVAVITGSTGRLGGALAIALAQAGCHCVCHYHQNAQLADELVELIRGFGCEAVAVGADLTRPEEIARLMAESESVGAAQILVNSAAVFSRQSLADVTLEQAQMVLNMNLISPVLVSREFAVSVNKNFPSVSDPIAKIINIVDVGAIRPWANYTMYCASKAGLVAATKSMAKELAPDICVNAVAPGVVNWPKDFDEAAKKRQLSFIPAGRIGLPSEVAAAAVFLLESDYITGQVLCVDGGRGI